jgi:peptidoglycan/LPS O-acetylase OafA/YrhL
MTLGERFERAGRRPAGFDYLRLFLAAAVITQHSINVTQGLKPAQALFFSSWRLVLEPILPMFFALSGFLVAGSLYPCRSLVSFLGLRVLRIMPALAAEILLSALVLGPLFTALPLAQYFSARAFFAYFCNIVGYIHFALPGVFLGNPWRGMVNTQLWTVPLEMKCYCLVLLVTVSGIFWRPPVFVGLLAAAQVAMAGHVVAEHPGLGLLVDGTNLIFTFFWGTACYVFRDRIRADFAWFIAALALMVGLPAVPGGDCFVAVPAVYATVWLGTANPPRIKLLLKGDYSYGMYLYGFPIQQSIVVLMPGIGWYADAVLALSATFGVAHLSWWYVEKPALQLKTALQRAEARLLAMLPRHGMVVTFSRATAERLHADGHVAGRSQGAGMPIRLPR